MKKPLPSAGSVWTEFTPSGGFPLAVAADEVGITKLHINPRADGRLGTRDDTHVLLVEARLQLEAYFARQRKVFDLPLSLHGTKFQRRVWQELLRIPWGESRSYLDIARSLGDAGATRAVGMANGANPVAVIVPCHRVIRSGGGLGGYSGGLDYKRLLLALEGIEIAPSSRSRNSDSRSMQISMFSE